MPAHSVAHKLLRGSAYLGAAITISGLTAAGILAAQAKMARLTIGQPFGEDALEVSGTYGHGPGTPISLGAIGDSTAAGLGADRPEQAATAILASGLAALAGRAVKLTSVAVVGATSLDLEQQVTELIAKAPALEVALIFIGGNDVTHLIRQEKSVAELSKAVRRLRAIGAEVVVATCPDLGTIKPVPRPLRWVGRYVSRSLAAAQTVAVVQAGGRTVSIGDIIGPEFDARPADLFSTDQFHPSAAGYARVAAAVLPSVAAAARVYSAGGEPLADRRRGDRVTSVDQAAAQAASRPGTEVSAEGNRWSRGLAERVQLRWRRREALPTDVERQD